MDRDQTLAKVENYLAFMELADCDLKGMRNAKASREHYFPLSAFKDAEPMCVFEGLTGAERTYAPDEQDPRQLTRGIDVAFIVPGEEDGTAFCLRRFRSMSMAETRGKIRPWSPNVVEDRTAIVGDDGTFNSVHTIWGWSGRQWQNVKPNRTGNYSINAGEGVGIAHQHATYREMLWHVSIGFTGMDASILIPCDARATLDLFRTRELPAGKSRRDALMHWVSQHWRRKPTDPAEAIRVHEHLRGQTAFAWANGMSVTIRPAIDDLKRIKAAKQAKNAVAAP